MQTAVREADIDQVSNRSLPLGTTAGSLPGRTQAGPSEYPYLSREVSPSGVCLSRETSALALLPTGLSPKQSELLLNPAIARIPLPLYEGIKRALEFLATFVIVLCVAPIALFIALLIWCEDRGPVLYGQDRVGRHGKRFRFYKFRSMVTNADQIRLQLEAKNEADGPIFKIKNDPRITRVGRVLRKYSLDEIPQLFHVLYGQMSMVGPRPHLPREVAHYTEEQQERLAVRPGLICLREVCGRSRLSFAEWMALDLVYVQHRNLLLDAWVLLRLIPAVLRADGAY